MFPGRRTDSFKNFDRNFSPMRIFVVTGGIGTTVYVAVFHAKDAAHFVGELAAEAKNGFNGQ